MKFGTIHQILNPVAVTWPKTDFLKFKMAAAAILKIAFLAINHRPIVRFQRNFVRGSRTACWQGLWDNKCKCNPRWRTAAMLKIVKSPYLSEKSSDFDKIWYTASDIEPGYSHVTRNWNFSKKRISRWRPPPSWILKISISGHVTVTGFNIWCSVPNFVKIGQFFTA